MSIVGQPALTLPDGTTLRNYDTLLDRHGVIGIKTGSTTAAGGCFMLAARGVVDGRAVEVLGVVLGQHASPLIGSALQASQALISPALASVRSFTAVPAGTTVAQVVSPWASPVAVKTTRRAVAGSSAGRHRSPGRKADRHRRHRPSRGRDSGRSCDGDNRPAGADGAGGHRRPDAGGVPAMAARAPLAPTWPDAAGPIAATRRLCAV